MKRLLLDEMLSAKIAEQLVSGGLDAVAVCADPALRGMSDADLLDWATFENRALVTDNVSDFVALNASWASQVRTHPGMIFISSKGFPQDRSRIGRIVATLKQRDASGRWPAPGQYDFL